MARLTWDKNDILQALKKLHKEGKGLSYTLLAKKNQPLVSAAAYHFGSYRVAVEKAGINYADVVRRPRWTKQEIIKLIKNAKREGQDLHWSAVTKRGDELGRAAFASLQERLFGSWDRALAGAGLDSDEISQYRKWGKDSIVSELKARSKESEALNSGAVQKEDAGLHAAAVRHFGSYDEALRTAKIDPTKIRRRQRWSKDEVVRQLKSFAKKHGVTDAALREHQPALYGAALRLFGSIVAARDAAK